MTELKENTGFEAFSLYHGLKLHFTSKSYDFIKYNGKTNITKDAFLKRKDKYSFYRLSRKFNILELKDYLISNFVYGNSTWVGEMIGADGEHIYNKWRKINQSLTYAFEKDILYLFDKYGIKSEEIFRVDRGQHPALLLEVMSDCVNIETLIVMNSFTNFVDGHWQRIQDDVVWPNWKLKFEKYTPFIVFDKLKFKNILKEKLEEYE